MIMHDDKKRSTPVFDNGVYWGIQKFAYDESDNIEYIGRNKAIDAATSRSDWYIWKIIISNGLVTDMEMLEGVWDDRASLDWN